MIIHPSLGLGGAEKIIAFVADSLCGNYDVSFLGLKNIERTITLSEEITEEYINCYSDDPIVGMKMIYGLSSFRNMCGNIKKKVFAFHPDLIICFDLRVLLSLYLSGVNKKTKVLFSERADPYENPQYWAFLLRRIYKSIDYIVFQTDGAREFYGSFVQDKSCIIPNPALPRVETAKHRDWNRVNNTIFSAGRFQRRKGFDILIDAFARIESKYPDVKLEIYGDGDEKANLYNQIVRYGLNDRIIIKKPVNGVVELNIDSRLFVLPSRSEGIPNIVIEAMYYGIPCVVTDCRPGGARMLSGDGRYCVLADNDDPGALAVSIEYAMENEELMKDMTLKAKESLKRFDENDIKQEWIRIVSKVLGR